MYSFKFREIEMNSGKRKLLIDFEDEKNELLSTFLETEVITFSDNIIFCLNQVLENGSEYEEFNGNVCGLEINKNRTQIFDNLASDGMGKWCDIDTNELKKLVELWLSKTQEYEEHGKL